MGHNNSIPIGLTTRLNTKKQAIVKTRLSPIDDQNPNRANRNGKTKNMGSVGMTYQKVKDACSAIAGIAIDLMPASLATRRV